MTKKKKASTPATPKRRVDPEISALGKVTRAANEILACFEDIGPDAEARVRSYISSRAGIDVSRV